MKIQPFEGDIELMTSAKPPSLLSRLFSASRSPAAEDKLTKPIGIAGLKGREKNLAVIEPSSVCLEKMVKNFLEETNEKPSRCGRRRCRCFNGNRDDSSDDDEDEEEEEEEDYDSSKPIPPRPSEILKSLASPFTTPAERSLVAIAARIIAGIKKTKSSRRVGIDLQRRVLVNELIILEWDAAICTSHWETTPSFPSGKSISNEHKYIDVIIEEGERVIICIDLKSEFKIPRSTRSYRRLLEMVPTIFVGRSDRLLQIVAVMSEAAKRAMKKEGLHIPPWRKLEYMRSKWISPHQRLSPLEEQGVTVTPVSSDDGENVGLDQRLKKSCKSKQMWQPPTIQPKQKPPVCRRGELNISTGLSFIL